MIYKTAFVLTLACLGLAACDDAKPVGGAAVAVTKNSYDNGTVTKNKLVLSAYAMRAALGSNPNTSAYVTISNEGTIADRLVSATCACAEHVTLHTMTMSGGMMRMNEITEGFPIAPGQVLTFVPGGDHIMLEGLKTPPHDGESREMTLTFERAGPIVVKMPVSDAPLAKN